MRIKTEKTAFLLIVILLVTGIVTTGYASKDTLEIYELTHELHTPLLDLGPDFEVVDNTFFYDESEMPSVGKKLYQFVVPFKGHVLSRFGIRRGRMHTGTDIKLQLGDTVITAFKGVVSRAQTYYGYGKLVVVDHPLGIQTYYAHLSEILVSVGDTLTTGQVVGLGGRTGRATGTHLHFEIRENGKAYNPELVFDFDSHTIKPEVISKEMLADLAVPPPKSANKQIANIMDGPGEYVIRSGDSLWTISRRFQVTINELCELNNLTTRSVLKIGTVLRLY